MKSTTTSVDIPIEERQPGESAVRGASINASIPFVPINEGKIEFKKNDNLNGFSIRFKNDLINHVHYLQKLYFLMLIQ